MPRNGVIFRERGPAPVAQDDHRIEVAARLQLCGVIEEVFLKDLQDGLLAEGDLIGTACQILLFDRPAGLHHLLVILRRGETAAKPAQEDGSGSRQDKQAD